MAIQYPAVCVLDDELTDGEGVIWICQQASSPGPAIWGKKIISYLTTANPIISTGTLQEIVVEMPALEIDPINGSIQYKTLLAPAVFTEVIPDGQYVILRLVNGLTQGITWPVGTIWVGGTPDTITDADVFVFWSESGNTYGLYSGAY